MEQIVRFLIPFFLGSATDFDAARLDILETLASYGAQTRAQMLKAAQIIAFSMSVLETLAEIDASEMSPTLRLRYRGCANNLNRSEQQHEKSLSASLACGQPAPSETRTASKPKHQPQPQAEPVNDCAEADVQQTLGQAQSEIDNCRDQLSGHSQATKAATSTSQQDRNKKLWGGAMMDTLAQMGMPVVPAPTTPQPRR